MTAAEVAEIQAPYLAAAEARMWVSRARGSLTLGPAWKLRT